MTNKSKISIITPSFNQGHYLEETILSVLNQNYPNLEYIIIDGASTDNSVEIIKKYAERLHYWISEKDKGQSEAINKGLAIASGDIVAWLNSDDLYLPGALQTAAKAFDANPHLDILHGRSILFGEKTKEQIIGLNESIEKRAYLAAMKFPQPSSFFSKRILNANSLLNTELHYAMDFELVSKAILNNCDIKAIPDVLSKYRMHADSKSNNDFIFLKDWGLVVCQTLLSFNTGKKYANQLLTLNLLNKNPHETYSHSIALNDEELKNIFLEHLHLQYHYHYRFHHFKIAKNISRFLETEYPDYHKKMNFKKYDLRASIVPAFVYRLFRKD